MLSLKQTKEVHYYIQLDGETIHGGLTKDEATSFMHTYHKIWEAGQASGRIDVEDLIKLLEKGESK
jgi:hypothetical protein